ISRTKIELLLVADQLVAEFVIPGLHGGTGDAVSENTARANDQQGIRLPCFVACCSLEMLANGAQRRVERIARPERPGEIFGPQKETFGLNDHAELGAFDVDRPPPRPLRTFIRNEGVPLLAVGTLVLRFLKLFFLAVDFGLQSSHFRASLRQ